MYTTDKNDLDDSIRILELILTGGIAYGLKYYSIDLYEVTKT